MIVLVALLHSQKEFALHFLAIHVLFIRFEIVFFFSFYLESLKNILITIQSAKSIFFFVRIFQVGNIWLIRS